MGRLNSFEAAPGFFDRKRFPADNGPGISPLLQEAEDIPYCISSRAERAVSQFAPFQWGCDRRTGQGSDSVGRYDRLSVDIAPGIYKHPGAALLQPEFGREEIGLEPYQDIRYVLGECIDCIEIGGAVKGNGYMKPP